MTGAKAEAGRASAPSTRIAPATTEPDTATSGWRSGCIERGSLGLGVGTCWSSNSSSMTDGSARSAGVCEASDGACARQIAAVARSEEHTSELQSLMRISYAVFCFNKKNESYTSIYTADI